MLTLVLHYPQLDIRKPSRRPSDVLFLYVESTNRRRLQAYMMRRKGLVKVRVIGKWDKLLQCHY